MRRSFLILFVIVLLSACGTVPETAPVAETAFSEPTGTEQPASASPEDEATPTDVDSATLESSPTVSLEPTAQSSVAELKDKWRPALRSSVMVVAGMEGLFETTEKRQAEEIDGFQAFGELLAVGLVFRGLDEGLAEWEPESDQAELKERVVGHVEAARNVIAQWADDEITSGDVRGLLDAEYASSLETLEAVQEAMIADGLSETDVQVLAEELVSDLEEAFSELESETNNTDVEGSSPADIQFEVSQVTSYVDSAGFLHFIGLLTNMGDNASFVEAVVNLRDDAGKLVATETGYVEFDVVYSGETVPFRTMFFEDDLEWSEHEVIVQADPVADWLEPYREFEVISAEGRMGSFRMYEIVGEVENTGDQDAELVQVVALLYDAEGNLMGVETAYTELDTVPAGATSSFNIMVTGTVEGTIDSFELLVEGDPINE